MKPGLIKAAPPRLTGLPFLAIAAYLIIVWGTAFNMLDVVVRHMSPIWLVAWRTLIATFLIVSWALFKGYRFPKLTDKRWLWYLGLALTGMVIPFFLTASAQTTIDSGISAILTGTMPLLTLGLAHIFTAEKMSRRKVIGFFIGFIGTVILFLPEDLSWGLVMDWKAQLLVMGAALCYAITTVAAKKAPETPSTLGAAMMVGWAAVASVSAALMTGPPDFSVPAFTWILILALAIGSTAIATIFYLFMIERNGPTTLAKINYFPPFAAVLVGIWLLNEPFTIRIAIAFGVIMLGVWIARNKREFIPH